MNSNMFIESLSLTVTIFTILAPPAAVSSKTSSTAAEAEAEAEVVYEWSRLEYEIAGDPGILADKYRVRRLFESCVFNRF